MGSVDQIPESQDCAEKHAWEARQSDAPLHNDLPGPTERQPKLCGKCKEQGHLVAQYTTKIYATYKKKGHKAKECK